MIMEYFREILLRAQTDTDSLSFYKFPGKTDIRSFMPDTEYSVQETKVYVKTIPTTCLLWQT